MEAMSHSEVTLATSRNDGDDQEWVVTVHRLADFQHSTTPPMELPYDVQRALWSWLQADGLFDAGKGTLFNYLMDAAPDDIKVWLAAQRELMS